MLVWVAAPMVETFSVVEAKVGRDSSEHKIFCLYKHVPDNMHAVLTGCYCSCH